MEFLKEILGEELFAQVKTKIDAHNGDEANKDKIIKLANLTSGEYVGKGKHEALETALKGKDTELAEANKLIEELKKSAKGNEDVQGKIAEYEATNAKLQEELAATKMKAAIKVALMSEKAVDVDYLTYKLNEKLGEKGEKLELDENDNIKGWDNHLTGLKTQFPKMFETVSNDNGFKPVDNNGLPTGDTNKGITKEEFDRMGYQSRLKLKNEQPEVYDALVGR